MLYPAHVAYSKITAEPCNDTLAVVIPHPVARVIYTAIRECHFVEGGPDDLLDLIARGTTANDEAIAYALTRENYVQ